MKRYISAFLLAILFLAAGCSKYDDSRILQDMDEVDAILGDIEGQMKGLGEQMSALGELLNSKYVTLISTDADGRTVITYMAPDGTTHTVSVVTGDQVVTLPIIGAAQDGDAWYWRVTTDNGKTWEWIYADEAQTTRFRVGGEMPELGVDAEGCWTVNGEPLTRADGSKVLADDVSNRLFRSVGVDEETGEALFTLSDGSTFRLQLFEALTLAFDAPVYSSVPDANTRLKIKYTVGGSEADEALVDIFTAYNVTATIDPAVSTITVSMDAASQEGDEGNILVMAHSAAGTVLKPLFFTYGTAVIGDPEYNGATGDIVLEGDLTQFEVAVSANIDYSVSVSDEAQSWLWYTDTRALTTRTYAFTADAYEDASGIIRTGELRFANELYNISASITVRQSPNLPEGTGGGIASAGDLVAFANAVNAGGSTARWQNEAGEVVLLNDIDMTGIETWTPIGGVDASTLTGADKSYETAHPFQGVFDGQGFAIRNLHYAADTSAGGAYALFGSIENATVRNLVLGDAATDIEWTFTGKAPQGTGIAALVVYAVNSTVENVENYYDIHFAGDTSDFILVGGLAAMIKNATLGGRSAKTACVNYGDVYTDRVSTTENGSKGVQNGGICAVVSGDEGNVVQYCDNYGYVACPTGRTGGLVGTFMNGTIRNCNNYGFVEDDRFDQDLTYNHKRMGGLVGGTGSVTTATIESCINYGNVFAHHGCRTGGLVGHNNVSIVGCENRGAILSDHEVDGHGSGWACGYSAASSSSYTNVSGCTAGGYVGDYSAYKDAPEQAPAASEKNAFAYKNDEYFDASKNQ